MSAGPTVTLTFAGDASKLNQAFDGVGNSAAGMSSKVSSSSSSLDNGTSALNRFGDAADGGESKAQGFADIIGGSGDIFQSWADDSLSMSDRLQMLGGGIADLSGGIASFLVPALSSGVAGIKAMSMALLTSPITWIVLGIMLLVGAFIYLWNNVEGFRNFWKGAWEGIKTAASAAVAWIGSALNWFSELPGKMRDWFGRAKDGAVNMLGNLVSWVSGLPGRILSALGNLGSTLLSAGGDLLRGLWNGISGAASWLRGKIGSFFGNLLPGWAKKMLGIASPSKVFADIGKWIPEGMAVGIEHNLAPVEDASAAMGKAAMGDYMAGVPGGRSGTAGAGSGPTITFGGNTDSAFASAFMKLVRTGQIQVRA